MTAGSASLLTGPEIHDACAALFKTCEGQRQDLQRAIAEVLRGKLARVHLAAERRLLQDGDGTRCAESLSNAEDAIISEVLSFASNRVFPPSDPQAESLAIVATGGYGRGTLAPRSDIDLIFLTPAHPSHRVLSIIEFVLYVLWDSKQKVGHATRSVSDCIKLANTDSTILTATLEARHVCGDEALFQSLAARFRHEIVSKHAKRFIAEKLAERDLRHRKAGESRYLVEPDVKDGKGGLRDLHTLFWIAKYLYATNSPAELAKKGALSPDDLSTFRKCERFLWAVRCHLHFLSNQAGDRLSFDRQSEIAERLGYRARGGLRHVERFMKHYFLVAKDVGDLTRILCADLESRQVKEIPVFNALMNRITLRSSSAFANAPSFRAEGGRIVLVSPHAFSTDPVNAIRLFAAVDRQGLEIHPATLKQLRRALPLIRGSICTNAEANAVFIEMLTGSDKPDSLLRMMNEAGVLGRFIPEFGKIVSMMQFNMYHHYTVDEHLIRTVGIVAQIDRGRLSEDHPLSTAIMPTISNKKPLYVAALLHDIAKGGKEHHSVAGERIALRLCPRLGLSPDETETVAWLVRHHLLMSETAQMRDLHDFKTILDFSSIVQSLERLKLLLVLTVADIRAVGPEVWNGWKGQLLRTLYTETETILTGGHSATGRRERIAEAQRALREKLPGLGEEEFKSYALRHYDAYWLSVSADKQARHYALIERSPPRSVTTEIETHSFTAVTEITIYAPDHPRLLALITGACAAAGASIASAQIFTTSDGMALDTVLLQREYRDDADERRRAERVAEIIKRALRGELWLNEAVAQARKPHHRIDAFSVEPRVIVDNTSSNRFTLVEINGLDRIGLLFDLTEAIYRLNLNIASAHITTFGEKAIDVFYVADLTGAKIESDARRRQIEASLMQVLHVYNSPKSKRA